MMSYLDLTILDMHKALVEKKVTSLELVEEAIERLKNDKTNALEATNYEEALKEAALIEEVKEGEYLKGIPFVCKDNYSTEGIETTASSNVLVGYVPIFDAEVVARLKKEGAIMLAKSAMDELAMGGTGTTGHKGITTNPYDEKRIIGGSSSGSCSLVTSAAVPFALGSDTGDSVRKPASHGGIVGFKPTWGRISRFGLFPFAPSLDTIAYFTRSVEDQAILTRVLSGYDEKDMSSSTREVEDYLSYLSKEDTPKRVGYFKEVIDAIEDKNIVKSFKKLLESLKEKGYEVKEYSFSKELLDALYPTYMIISCAEATSNDANLDGIKFGIRPTLEEKTWEEYMTSARTRGFSSLIKRRFIIGSFSLLAENQKDLFLRAQKARHLIVDAMNEFYKEHDYLLLPCGGHVAPLISSISNKWNSKPDFVENHLGIANLAGLPSLTVPLDFEDGLPFGVNITGRQFEEGNVLKLGYDIENITGLRNVSSRKGE